MKNESNTGHTQAQKLSAEIKKTWGKLTDEEIGFQVSKPDKFFDAIKTKYSINKEEAEKTIKKLDAECAAACSASEGKDSNMTSGSPAKAANDSSAAKPAPKAANA